MPHSPHTLRPVSPAWLARLRASRKADPWEHGVAIIDRDSRSVIGSAGFKGPPDEEGVVEIAYDIVPGYQRRGYATEAATALFAIAFGSERVRLVRAHTLPHPEALMKAISNLYRCGCP